MSRIPVLEQALASRKLEITDEPGRVPAAVAIILVPEPDSVLLIKRATREGDRWSGQMAFPGGRHAATDPDLDTTARRETWEEVGVDLSRAGLIGRLDDLTPRTPSLPPVTVAPFIYALAERPQIIANQEVAGSCWAGLDELVAPGVYRPYEFEYQGSRAWLPGYHLDLGVVWGLTERILTPMLGLVGLKP